MTAPTSPPACAAYPRGATLLCVCQHQEHATSEQIAEYIRTETMPRHCGLIMVWRRVRDR